MLPTPTSALWTQNAENFERQWGFPRAIGALDGKHFRCRVNIMSFFLIFKIFKAPPDTGSAFYNFKGYFSVVLLAMAGPNYEFIMIDVGASGRNSDAGLYQTSEVRNNKHKLVGK